MSKETFSPVIIALCESLIDFYYYTLTLDSYCGNDNPNYRIACGMAYNHCKKMYHHSKVETWIEVAKCIEQI